MSKNEEYYDKLYNYISFLSAKFACFVKKKKFPWRYLRAGYRGK